MLVASPQSILVSVASSLPNPALLPATESPLVKNCTPIPCCLSRLLRLTLLFLLCLVLPAVAGCGKRLVEVKGTVTYKNAPLKLGTVQFLGSDGLTYVGNIQPDGTYSAKVITGSAKVMVNCIDDSALVEYSKAMSKAGRGSDKGKPAAPPKLPPSGNFNLIPEKYNDFNGSGLTTTVSANPTVYDIKLD